MPEYLSPGVYVEEVDAGPKPIEGVSTSTAGAVGVTARGPDTGKPVLVTSFMEYERIFGGGVTVPEAVKANWKDDPQKGEFWTFPLAVKGFFDNGGQRLYVRRVVSSGASPSKVGLGQGLMTPFTQDAKAQATTVQVSSVIGISRGTATRIWIDGTLQPQTFKVTTVDNASRTVTFDTKLPLDVKRGRDFVQITTSQGTSMNVSAKSRGEWGRSISIRVNPMDAGAFALLADADPANKSKTTKITANVSPADNAFDVDDATDLAAKDHILVDGTDWVIEAIGGGGGKTITISSKGDWLAGTSVKNPADPNAPGTTISADALDKDVFDVVDATQLNNPPAAPAVGDKITVNGIEYRLKAVAANKLTVERLVAWRKNWSVIRVRRAAKQVDATPELFVWGASSLYEGALVEIEDPVARIKYYGTITNLSGNKVKLSLNYPAAPGSAPAFPKFDLFEGSRLRLIEAVVDVRYAPKGGTAFDEEIRNVRLSGDKLDRMHIENRLSAISGLVDLALPPPVDVTSLDKFPLSVDGPANATPEARIWMPLTGGDDDFGSLDADAFVGEDKGPGKRTGIQALEDIDDISLVLAPSIWSSLVQNALIQQCEILKYRFAILDPRPVNPASVDAIGDIRSFREGFDTKYAALYFPRIEVRDPFLKKTVGVGPSGHMAGIYARVDVERGVHKAPANEVIRGIDTSNGFHGLEDEITKREQDMLNPKGINALRFFPDRGTRVWGARTLSSDGSWKYINVRRIFIWVERSIDVGTQWVVFEPNDEKTWARVRQTITNFLTTVWRSGALFGSKADEAFFVRCDRTTMTQDDIDNGRLICVIGICPVKPAEFVIFRIQQKLIDQKQP